MSTVEKGSPFSLHWEWIDRIERKDYNDVFLALLRDSYKLAHSCPLRSLSNIDHYSTHDIASCTKDVCSTDTMSHTLQNAARGLQHSVA
jgi:hypothetical protein